jgi:hypothetical protein
MPEAVNEWIHTNDMEEVEKIQDEILRDYADDFSKHAPLAAVEFVFLFMKEFEWGSGCCFYCSASQ